MVRCNSDDLTVMWNILRYAAAAATCIVQARLDLTCLAVHYKCMESSVQLMTEYCEWTVGGQPKPLSIRKALKVTDDER